MKKTISCTLAATLATSPITVMANENVNVENNKTIVKEQSSEITGKLEVDINFALPIINSNNNDMKIKLMGGNITEEINLNETNGNLNSGITYSLSKLDSKGDSVKENENVSFIRIAFENLPIGEYSFELSGNGYKTTKVDNLDITSFSKRVRIGTQENKVVKSYGETEGKNEYEIYPALFLAGDVNVNDVIDMDDYKIVLEDIKSDSNKYDINKDSKTDITDLSYIKGSIGSEQKIPGAENRSYIEDTDAIINPENVGIGVAGIINEVNLKNLLKSNTESVKIETKSAPSEDNPVSIKMNLVGTEVPDLGTPELELPEGEIPDLETPNQEIPEIETPETINISRNTENSSNETVKMEKVVIKAPNIDGSPEKGTITYTDENGNKEDLKFGPENTKVSRSGEKEISIDLGSQVAVKEISIDVTGNRGNKNISEIAKIEFLNNVYKEIPKPSIDIPTIKTLETSTELHDERITISWEPQPNVTGYEVKYYKIDDKGNKVGSEKKLQTNKTNMNILDKAIKPYDTFRVSIQSLNGDWSSGYAEDLVGKPETEGGLSEAKKKELIPYDLDGKADNVNSETLDPLDEYYGTGTSAGNPNMGSVSDIQVVPKIAPIPPRNLKVKDGYRSLSVSWENHIQARDFDIYYRKIGSEENGWTKANDPSIGPVAENSDAVTKPDKDKLSRSHSYTIKGLEDESSYEIKTTATNHLGTSKMSEGYLGTTTSISPPQTTNYKLINRPKENVKEGEIPTGNIIKVENSNKSNVKYDNEFAIVDNDYTTNYTIDGWNKGGDAPTIEFDKEYNIDRVNVAFNEEFKPPYLYQPKIIGYDAEGNSVEGFGNVETYYPESDSKGRKYFQFKLDKPMKVKKIKVIMNVYPQNTSKISVSEIKFYESDNIRTELANLYEDEFRIKLKKDVTQETIDDLIKRVNTMDKESLEYNPDRTSILSELETAQKLLNEIDLSNEIIELDPKIKSNHGGVSLGMGNDWQSLGSVVRPQKTPEGNDEKLVVYMGAKNGNKNLKVQIGFLQTYGQPGAYINQPYTLKPGRNEFTIPKIIQEDVEKGGQVMVRVEGAGDTTEVKVRLGNAIDIPHLNVNNIINDKDKESEVKDKIRVYIRNLKKYVADLPNMYPKEVSGEDRVNNIYTYEPTTSVLNNTDIEGDRFTLTMPANQILKGIESGMVGNEDAQVERVYNALLAWEQQIQVTFAKKGVYESVDKAPSKEEYEKNKAPLTRMNIKYQRMMMGAAGYASGHHVGVGYGGVPAYMQGVPFKFDENQNVVNPQEAGLYGTLIAHEIGHVTDIGSRTYPETSNNLTVAIASSMLNQNPAKVGNIYPKLYEKVTSHTMGLSTNRTVVLAMLWQVYLAYEDEDTYKMLFTDNDTDPNNDSYFAKLNRAYRTLSEEEKKNADRDQLLIRISSKVVGKDLSAFYYSHGIMPNADTIKYVSQFPKEERQIQYINDEARRQRLAGTADMASDTKAVASFGKDNKGNQILNRSYVNQDVVPINLSVTKDSDKILGYEIIRNGKPAGFINANKNGLTTYNDVVDNVNNRVFTYEVIAYDYNLNPTDKVSLGTVKVRHDGSVNKNGLDITSNTIDKNDENYDKHSDNPNETLKNVIDNNSSSIYEGKVHNDACEEHNHDEANQPDHSKDDAYVVIDTKEVRSLAGIKYTAPTSTSKFFKKEKISKSAVQNFEIQVSRDGEKWTKVKEGEFKLDPNEPTETIYFDKEGSTGGNQLNVYNTRFVKLIAKGSSEISVGEFDLIAPPGDNIEIGVASDNINYKNGLGLLKEEYVYQPDNPSTEENEKRSIPKGSVIITGEYRGNPAFNVPLVLNENEEHIADQYKGILMAEVPDNGNLEEIAEGNWVYWVEPQFVNQFMQNKEIFAELYRTDTADAQSGGQRLVSDSFKLEVPDELPEISLSGGSGKSKTGTEKKVIEIDTKLIKEISNNR